MPDLPLLLLVLLLKPYWAAAQGSEAILLFQCSAMTAQRVEQVQTEMMGDIHHFAWRARHRNQTVYLNKRDAERFGDWASEDCDVRCVWPCMRGHACAHHPRHGARASRRMAPVPAGSVVTRAVPGVGQRVSRIQGLYNQVSRVKEVAQCTPTVARDGMAGAADGGVHGGAHQRGCGWIWRSRARCWLATLEYKL